MPANLNAPFAESCCDGGETNKLSAQPCGCDPKANYVCDEHAYWNTVAGEPKQFTVKDSGARQQFVSGMRRDTATDKVDYSLALDGPMFERYARHLTAGAKKYDKRNWMKAAGQPELERFRESALRHFLQWYRGEGDEDHAAAVMFNINGAEYTKDRILSEAKGFGAASGLTPDDRYNS